MKRNKYNPEAKGAGVGWAVLFAGVALYDTYAQETLSNGFRRGIESDNPLIRASVYAGLGILALHLLDVTPEQVDPVDNLAKYCGKLLKGEQDV